MPKKLTEAMLILLLCAWLLFALGPIEQITTRLITPSNIIIFHGTIQALIYSLGLGLLILFLGFTNASLKPTNAKGTLPLLLLGWGVPLLFCIGFILYTNPNGVFPWGSASSYIYINARTIKTRIYLAEKQPAEILVLGSSRAFSIPSKKLQDIYGLNAFNMSVEAGGVIDFLSLTNFVLAHQDTPPKLLLVEFSHISLRIDAWETGPMILWPYMPGETGVLPAWNGIKSPFSFTSLTDSVYTQFLYPRQPPSYVFLARGNKNTEPLSQSLYHENIEKDLEQIRGSFQCRSLSKEGQEKAQNFIQLAQKEKIAVIFYTSPLNSDFTKRYLAQYGNEFERCKRLFNQYAKNLAKNQENIFFVDLLQTKRISDLKNKGFIDTWHLTSYGAEKVLEALEPSIHSALEWVKQARIK